jgi:hypothetical protein
VESSVSDDDGVDAADGPILIGEPGEVEGGGERIAVEDTSTEDAAA